MTPQRWRQIEQLYVAALDRDPALRPAFLDEACAGDGDLRREVEAMLQQPAQGMLDAPLWQADAPLNPGAQLGPYRILGLLGAGGMGQVYRAQDTRLGRTVAIKTLKARFTERFQREARAISALNHPHICTLYDIGSQDGAGYLVMEYVEGQPIKGPFKVEEALRLAIQIASALEAAHGEGILHRDLKPGNILVSKTGVKLLDFGLAKLVPTALGDGEKTVTHSLTQVGQILGTLAYMPPEQLEGRPVDARGDIFSFGLVLYEMLMGRRAFEASSQNGLIAAILKEDPPPLATLKLPLPTALDRTVRKCLAKDPALRWQTARDLLDELEWIAEGESRTREPDPVATRRGGRERLAWGLATLFAAALAAALFFLGRPGEPQPRSWSGTVLGGSIIASHPRISPDGQLLAFRAIVDGLSQVAVMKPNSSSWTALTHDRANGAVASLAWSRDGSKIYFDREWGPGRIYSIGALGGEPRLVFENAWIPEPLPDGSLVAQRPSSEGRGQLIHFWPDSGRTQVLPATVRYTDSPNVRAFPDGHEIAVFGLPANASGPPRLFLLNLQSLAIHDLSSNLAPAENLREPIAISQDGRFVLIQRRRDDTVDTIALPRSGSAAVEKLISLPGTAAPLSQDVAPDGAIYMDHSGFERSILRLSPSGAVQGEIPIPQLAQGGGEHTIVSLPDGSMVFNVLRNGRSELFLGRTGAEPQPLLNTPESAALPGALLGDGNLAFIIGTGDQVHLAIASLHEGRVIRRFPGDARLITAISAPADGRTIYYASDGIVWSQPVSGGDPRKIGQGYDLAVDPSGRFLYLMRTGVDGYELFRMPAAGGEATRVLPPPGFNLTPMPLSPTAVDREGRILLPVNVLDLFFFQAALLDPARNTIKLVPVPPRTVVSSAGWTPDGNIAGLVVHWSSSIWCYRISVPNRSVR